MEAWIVHIRETSVVFKDRAPYTHNRYTAWSTEKQAYRAVAKYLAEATEIQYRGPFAHDYELGAAVKALVEVEKIKEAIELVNKYSRVEDKRNDSDNLSRKIEISIVQSKFLGSVWE